jgi:hypothetical protein
MAKVCIRIRVVTPLNTKIICSFYYLQLWFQLDWNKNEGMQILDKNYGHSDV